MICSGPSIGEEVEHLFDPPQRRKGNLSLIRRASRWSGRTWKTIGAGSALIGALCFGLVASSVAPPRWRLAGTFVAGLFGVGLGGGMAVLVYLALTLQVRMRKSARRLESLVNIRPLTANLPVDLTGWAADPVLADEIVRSVVSKSPRLVLECGSGWSTVLVARCLAGLGEGRVVALEHERLYAQRTRRFLGRYGGAEYAEVVDAPLTERNVEGHPRPWYGPEAEDAVTEPVDLLLVDGPPGALAPESRYPAVPLLKERLAPDAVVLLDDGHRPDEARIAKAWGQQLGVEPRFVDSGEGIWVFELEGSTGDGHA